MDQHDTTRKFQVLALQRLGKLFTLFLIFVASVLVGFEFIFVRHGDVPVEENFMFPALFGFVAFVVVVLVGKLLRALIMRPETYYDDEGGDGDDLS